MRLQTRLFFIPGGCGGETVGGASGGELRRVDFGARYGGDEFAVILPETPKTAAAAVKLVEAADRALYQAKSDGRNRVRGTQPAP